MGMFFMTNFCNKFFYNELESVQYKAAPVITVAIEGTI